MKGTTLYHLLRGKRTTSVLLYGFFHELLPYLGAFPTLAEPLFLQILEELSKNGLLSESEGDYQLTSQGRMALDQQVWRFPEIDYFSYGKTGQTSWCLVKFAVQVVSYLSYSQKSYLPMENSPYYTQQIKWWLGMQDKQTLAVQLRNELAEVFQQLSNDQADFLANQFSGNQITGAVGYQLLPDAMQQAPYSQLYEDEAVHAFFTRVKKSPHSSLYRLVENSLAQNMNQSAQQTKQLLMQEATVEQVMAMRHLKKSTVNDHLIEWAILDEAFPFQRFIPSEIVGLLEKLESPVLSWQYREVNKEGTIPYESFRLFQIDAYRRRR